MYFTDIHGRSIVAAIKHAIAKALVAMDAGSIMSKSLTKSSQDHVESKYPSSKHWDPSKILEGDSSCSEAFSEGSADVGIAGASRAYHDVTIYPVHAKALTIPMHASAYGHSASDFNGLFTIRGKNALFMKNGSGIVAMFALASSAFQKQDKSLLPSDTAFANSIGTDVASNLDRHVDFN